MGHRLYQSASYVAFGALHPIWALHPKLRQGYFERWGRPQLKTGSEPGPRIWFHGASAGDVLGLKPLIAAVRGRHPTASVTLSVMTNTGHTMAQSMDVDSIIYAPYDLPGATRRTVAAVRPELLVLEYTELWPNLIHAAHDCGAKVALSNGRIHERRVNRYRHMFRWFGNPLRQMDLFLMRSDAEARRIIELGAPDNAVHVTGDTKFDNLNADVDAELVAGLKPHFAGRLVWVAGSTHEDEEALLLSAMARLKKEFGQLSLLIAPRYPARCQPLMKAAAKLGLSVCLRSELSAAAPDVVVVDSIGELASIYALGDITLVGGGFGDRGGQNILEPARCSKVVLFGPRMDNFRDSVALLYGRGGLEVRDEEQLVEVASGLLRRPEELKRLGGMARTAVSQALGAAERNAELLSQLLR